MAKKTFSALSSIVAGFCIAAFSAPAAACTDIANQWDCIHDGSTSVTSVSNRTYIGSATLDHWYTGTIFCNDVRATGDVVINSDGSADFVITNFTGTHSTNNPDCANVTFHNFNWTAAQDGTGSPTSPTDTTGVVVTYHTPEIQYNGTQVCYDSVPATFSNDGAGGSIFDYDATISGWSGNCRVDGTLYNSTLSAH